MVFVDFDQWHSCAWSLFRLQWKAKNKWVSRKGSLSLFFQQRTIPQFKLFEKKYWKNKEQLFFWWMFFTPRCQIFLPLRYPDLRCLFFSRLFKHKIFWVFQRRDVTKLFEWQSNVNCWKSKTKNGCYLLWIELYHSTNLSRK